MHSCGVPTARAEEPYSFSQVYRNLAPTAPFYELVICMPLVALGVLTIFFPFKQNQI